MLNSMCKMARLITLLYIFLLLMPPLTVLSADKTQYTWLARKADGMPPDKVVRMADKYAAEGRQGEALVLYAVVYGRFADGMDDRGKNLCALACKQAGAVYYERGDYVNALDRFVDGVKLSEQCAKPAYMANLYNNIGNVYGVYLDYEKAVDYYLKAYGFVRKHPDRKTERTILTNLTGMYSLIGDIPNARKFYGIGERLKDKASPVDVYMSGYNLSLIQAREGDLDGAIDRLKGLARFAGTKGLAPRFVCFAYQEIYNDYMAMGRPDSALKYMLMCDDSAREHDLQHTFASTLKAISDFYEDKGDVVKSNEYKSRYLDIMDSIYNTRKFDAAKNSLFAYEVGKTTREMEELRSREEKRMQTIRQQRVVMGAVCAVLVVTVAFLAVVWRQKRRINRGYADLYAVNREFMESQAQLTERLRKNRDDLKEKDERIAALESRLDRPEASGPATPKPQAKYQGSNLTEEQRRSLADAIQDIMENTTEFCDCNFSLDALAKLVGSNTTYVSQVINDTFNKSFNNYVNPYRIHLACSRLADRDGFGNLTMKAVGESVGFKSYTSFVNTFRKVTGMTPAIYLKMASRDGIGQGQG